MFGPAEKGRARGKLYLHVSNVNLDFDVTLCLLQGPVRVS